MFSVDLSLALAAFALPASKVWATVAVCSAPERDVG
jgi:hypothetical protein